MKTDEFRKWKRIDRGKKFATKSKAGRSGMKEVFVNKIRTQDKTEIHNYYVLA